MKTKKITLLLAAAMLALSSLSVYAAPSTGSIGTVSGSDASIGEWISSDSYDAIREALGQETMKSLEYRVAAGTTVSQEQELEIFSGIKGTDKNFTFTFEDGNQSVLYEWTFAGDQITDENIYVNLTVIPDAGNETVLASVQEDMVKMDIHFEHTGDLPGVAVVTVPVTDGFTGNNATLYFYDSQAGAPVLAVENVAVVDGYAAFPLSHCSDYILTAEMLRSLVPSVNNNTSNNSDNAVPAPTEAPVEEIVEESVLVSPKTGDSSVAVVMSVIVIMAAVAVVCGKKLYTGKQR